MENPELFLCIFVSFTLNLSFIMSSFNKVHGGFLGISLTGACCNLGTGCNDSNMKNSYAENKLKIYLLNIR